MKIQLEHNDIKINVELQGIESDKLQKVTKNLFNTFLDSIHIVNSESQTIIVDNELEKNSAEQESAEQESAAQEPAEQESAAQEGPPPLPDPNDPEDNQAAMAAALEAYEKAQAEKLAAASTFGLGGLAQIKARPPIMLNNNEIPSTAYRQQGGKTFYQAFVICTECRNKEKHFVERGTPFVNCRSCGKRNTIRPAAIGNFPHIDTFNNIYIGGAFKRADEREQNFQALQA